MAKENNRITIAHVLTTLALIISGITFLNDLTTEVAKQRVEIDHIDMRLSREIVIATDGRDQLAHRFDKLDVKIDKILEALTRQRR